MMSRKKYYQIEVLEIAAINTWKWLLHSGNFMSNSEQTKVVRGQGSWAQNTWQIFLLLTDT
jgi:hypothetical protein